MEENTQHLKEEASDPSTSAARLKELLTLEPKLSLEVSQNPSATAELLEKVYRSSKSSAVHERVARHPNTPPPILREVAKEHPDSFFSNPVVPLLVLEDPNFLTSLPVETTTRLLGSALAPKTFLLWGAEQGTEQRRSVAQNPQMPLELLIPLSKDKELGVLRALAQRSDAPGWLLEQLAWNDDVLLRTLVVQNPNASPGLLQMLGEYETGNYRHTHPRLPRPPMPALKKELQQLRIALAQNPKTPAKALSFLARDFTEPVRAAVAANAKSSPEILESLAGDPSPAIRLVVAQRQDLTAELIERLSKDKSIKVRKAVMGV